jgi:choice-of-anchor A domain-containing protein
MKHKVISLVAMVLFFGLSAGIALAQPLTGTQILNQFNLVVQGNATSTSHVDGRAYVGGDLTGGAYVQHPTATPSSSYAGLTVGGIASGVTVNGDGAVVEKNLSNSIINSGNGVVLGTATSSNFNGPSYYIGHDGGGNQLNGTADPGLKTGTAATAATSTDFGSVLTGLSSQLKNLTSNSSISINSNTATFNASAGSNGVAVFAVSNTDLAQGQFTFNLNGAKTVIINCDLSHPVTSANFLGGAATNIGAETIWNFYNATTLSIGAQFGGSVLAPYAAFTNSNNIEGGVYVDSLTQTGEIHLQPFIGNLPPTPTPEPSSLLLLGGGLIGFAGIRKKLRA